MYLNTLNLQGFYNNGQIQKCVVCKTLIGRNDDFAMIPLDGNALPSGIKPELYGENNREVVANVFICGSCARKSRSQLIELDEYFLDAVNHGPDHWTVHYPGE